MKYSEEIKELISLSVNSFIDVDDKGHEFIGEAHFDWLKRSMFKLIQEAIERGHADCKKDMEGDLQSVIGMLTGGTDRQKIANYIKEYLVKVVEMEVK